jgi:hypothetical protein
LAADPLPEHLSDFQYPVFRDSRGSPDINGFADELDFSINFC